MFIRNFILNLFQGLSLGFITGAPFGVHLVVAFSGLAISLVLVRSGFWLYLLAIILGMGTFVPFYPPIPAYMFGNYLLLAMVTVEFAPLVVRRMKDDG